MRTQRTRPPWLARVDCCGGAVVAGVVDGGGGGAGHCLVISHKRLPKESPRVSRSTPPAVPSLAARHLDRELTQRLSALSSGHHRWTIMLDPDITSAAIPEDCPHRISSTQTCTRDFRISTLMGVHPLAKDTLGDGAPFFWDASATMA